ncbi:MAG: LytTR family transcriptional regulator DNA-binding domain-containing protein [Flavobacteriaceae bacterium]|nr:LytTR family transcriptional regulator DNA-binding domain-containing protein [Flavobacteriaceae bacterium]
MTQFLYTPFPRPKDSLKTRIKVFGVGLLGSLFIILFKPFSIENDSGIWYYNLLLVSMGVLFSASYYVIDFLVPHFFGKSFKKWNLGKAILWYTFVILFVSAAMFLYKSFLGGFNDFTFKEYIYVIGRVSGIGLIVSFFGLGIFSYLNSRNLALLSSKELYKITAPNVKPITLDLSEVLYISSDDNYVDIHTVSNNKRDKIVFRSSLKNVEDQIINPLSPIYRCHRQYLINISYFKIKSDRSRKTVIELKEYGDEIPVSSKNAPTILKLLQTRP